MNIIIQSIGAFGIAANMIIYQQKEGKKILLFKLISDFLWFAHYFLLGAYTGAAIAVIGIFREFVFIKQDKKSVKNKGWLIFFICCSFVSSVFTWKNVFCIFPEAASIISVISFWKSNPNLTRLLGIIICVCMLIYDIIYCSYIGIVNELLTLVSVFFALLQKKGVFRS